jgi:hypothetical protein
MLAALLLTGCQGVLGPFQPRDGGRIDDPRVPITEQQRRGRDRMALPDDTNGVLPRSGAAPPGAPGRGAS